MNVLILAAGYGTRLDPLTNQIPKALIKVVDQVMLGRHVESCRALKPDHLFVISHHLSDMIQDWCSDHEVDRVFHEPRILGTGGPLRRLWKEGYRDDLLVVNCAAHHEIDLARFISATGREDDMLRLVTVDRPEVNTLMLDAQDRVVGVAGAFEDAKSVRNSTFAGIAWYSTGILEKIEDEHRDVTSFWQKLNQTGVFPKAWPTSATWVDIGTPQGLFSACRARLDQLGLSSWGSNGYAGSEVVDCVIGTGVEIARGSRLRSCVVLDGVELKQPLEAENSIIGKGFVWNCS